MLNDHNPVPIPTDDLAGPLQHLPIPRGVFHPKKRQTTQREIHPHPLQRNPFSSPYSTPILLPFRSRMAHQRTRSLLRTATIPQPPALAVKNKAISMKIATLKSDYQDLAPLVHGLDSRSATIIWSPQLGLDNNNNNLMPDATSHRSNPQVWDPRRVEGGSVTTFYLLLITMQLLHGNHAYSSFSTATAPCAALYDYHMYPSPFPHSYHDPF